MAISPSWLVHTTQIIPVHIVHLYVFYMSFITIFFSLFAALFKVRNGHKIRIRAVLAGQNYTSFSFWFSNLIAVCHRCHVFSRKWSRVEVVIKFVTWKQDKHQSNLNIMFVKTRVIYFL